MLITFRAIYYKKKYLKQYIMKNYVKKYKHQNPLITTCKYWKHLYYNYFHSIIILTDY